MLSNSSSSGCELSGISWESEFWPLLTSHVAWSWWQAQVNNEDFVDISQAFQVCTLLLLHDDMRTYTHMCYAALNNDKNDKLWRSRRIGIKASCQAHVIFKDYLIESLIIKSFLEFAMRCHISLYHFSTWWRLPNFEINVSIFHLNFTVIFKHLNKQSGLCLKITRNVSFSFENFCSIKTNLSGNTVWPQPSDFITTRQIDLFGIFNEFLSTRFTHNVEWDFFCYFQTLWWLTKCNATLRKKSQIS